MSDLTLKGFKDEHPEVAEEFEKELSAGHAEALSKAEEKGCLAERERITKLLSRAKPQHFSPTKKYPNGFVQHALIEGLSTEDILSGFLELNEKTETLASLQEASNDIPVESVETVDTPLSEQEIRRAGLKAAVARLNKGGSN